MILNALCMNDISDDDHTNCLKRGAILMCPMTCTDFESRTEGIQDTVMIAIDEAYKRGYRDGQMDLRKEQEATQKYWGKQTDEIKVGDEVIYQGGGIDDGSKGVVIGTCDKWCEVRFISSWTAVGVYNDTLTKTGRHFPQIAEILKQMQENENE